MTSTKTPLTAEIKERFIKEFSSFDRDEEDIKRILKPVLDLANLGLSFIKEMTLEDIASWISYSKDFKEVFIRIPKEFFKDPTYKDLGFEVSYPSDSPTFDQIAHWLNIFKIKQKRFDNYQNVLRKHFDEYQHVENLLKDWGRLIRHRTSTYSETSVDELHQDLSDFITLKSEELREFKTTSKAFGRLAFEIMQSQVSSIVANRVEIRTLGEHNFRTSKTDNNPIRLEVRFWDFNFSGCVPNIGHRLWYKYNEGSSFYKRYVELEIQAREHRNVLLDFRDGFHMFMRNFATVDEAFAKLEKIIKAPCTDRLNRDNLVQSFVKLSEVDDELKTLEDSLDTMAIDVLATYGCVLTKRSQSFGKAYKNLFEYEAKTHSVKFRECEGLFEWRDIKFCNYKDIKTALPNKVCEKSPIFNELATTFARLRIEEGKVAVLKKIVNGFFDEYGTANPLKSLSDILG